MLLLQDTVIKMYRDELLKIMLVIISTFLKFYLILRAAGRMEIVGAT